MPTDYILFNHGVSTRDAYTEPTYADTLFELIQSRYHPTSPRTLKKVALYWGDVNNVEEQRLLTAYRSSAIWERMWFKSIRETQIMRFVGDGALYLSRYVGAKIARVLDEQTRVGLAGFDPQEDRLHLITHSMGTIILFDMLFSARWDPIHVPGHSSVNTLRDLFFGIGPHPDIGIPLGSISTLGSPIGFFSLMDVDQSAENTTDSHGNVLSTHDITPRLEQMLINLRNRLGRKLPWYNFVHPGDPVAYPLEMLLPQIVDRDNLYIDVQDILIATTRLIDVLTESMNQSALVLLHGMAAHGAYMESLDLVEKIVQAIECASCFPPIATDDTPMPAVT
jgi:hypothetical protein